MQIWATTARNKDVYHLSSEANVEIHDGEKIRIKCKNPLYLKGHSRQEEITVQLERDEFCRIGKLYQQAIKEAIVDLAKIIYSSSSDRIIVEKVERLKKYWGLSNEEILGALEKVETPVERLKANLSTADSRSELARLLKFKVG